MKLITQNRFSKAGNAALFVFTFIAASVFAANKHNQSSSLRLLLPSNGEHTILVDNIAYQRVFDNFKMDNLRAGNHRIKIIKVREIVSRRGRYLQQSVIYDGLVFIPKNAKVWASVNNRGQLFIERTLFRGNGRGRYENNGGCGEMNGRNRDGDDRRYNGRDDYYDDDWEGYNDEHNENDGRYSDRGDNSPYSGNDSRNKRENSDHRYNQNRSEDSGNRYNQNRDDNSGNRYSQHDQTFNLTLAAIQKQSFDTERLKIAKNAAEQGYMTSNDIAEIAKLFSFESSRLEFAKFAYKYTTDKENYVIVQNAFQFNSSTSELQDYITQMGKNR